MAGSKVKAGTVEDYIAAFPKDVQAVLRKMRRTIAEAAPLAEEVISYQIPAFRQGRILLYYSAWTSHYSLFIPSLETLEAFAKRLSKYEVHKAKVKIPMAGPIPYPLISALVRYRVREVGQAAGGARKAATSKGKPKAKASMAGTPRAKRSKAGTPRAKRSKAGTSKVKTAKHKTSKARA